MRTKSDLSPLSEFAKLPQYAAICKRVDGGRDGDNEKRGNAESELIARMIPS